MRAIAAALLLLLTATAAAHPLDPLTADEHAVAFDVVKAHMAAVYALPGDALLFPFIALREPAKAAVKSGAANIPREATVHVFHPSTNRLWIAIVDLKSATIARVDQAPAGTQAAVTFEEYAIAEEVIRSFEPWRAAMRARGVDPNLVYIDVWAPGDDELPAAVEATLPHGARTRLLRGLAFWRGASIDEFDEENPQNPYVRPIEGVVATVDMNQRRVVHMTDTAVRPVSTESGNAPARRTDLKPMRVVQPNGGSFEVTGQRVRWQNWDFHVVLHPREGIVLHDVRNSGRLVAYRMSLSEIYVPYGMPDPNWSWRSAFDVGEYNLGMFAQTLQPDRDVPGHTYFFDSVFGTDLGETAEYDDTLGMYERDNGLLWSRTDPTTGARDSRGRRELVLTWNAWIGNYIYGFDWIFGQDGTIEVKVVLTGTLLLRGAANEEEASAPRVGVGVSAPNHQHFFSFRLDLDVDGEENEVHETEVRHIPHPLYTHAFGAHETHLTTEGFRDADPFKARHWEVSSAEGKSWAIETKDVSVPFAAAERAGFARHAFWATRYRDEERYAAGDFPNQGHAGEGLPSFVSNAEPLHGDVVVWPTVGITHVPRPEDYPVMPTETISLKIVPHGFFEKNPALDAQELPPQPPRRRLVRPTQSPGSPRRTKAAQ